MVVEFLKQLKPGSIKDPYLRPGVIQVKYDGYRMMIWRDERGPHAIGRLHHRDYAQEFPVLGQWINDKIPVGQVLDGELHTGTRSADVITGLNSGDFIFTAWGVYSLGLSPRVTTLEQADEWITNLGIDYPLTWGPGQSLEDFPFEGLVVKRWPHLGPWFKWKPTLTLDLTIQGVFEGGGKHRGRLGGFITAKGRVGNGFTDKQREEIWSRKDDCLGRIAEVECDCIDNNGNMRFPRFLRFRDDKVETDE